MPSSSALGIHDPEDKLENKAHHVRIPAVPWLKLVRTMERIRDTESDGLSA